MKRPYASQQHLRQFETDTIPGSTGAEAPPARLTARWLRDESGQLICRWER